ncbi:ABC transporter ATP-binding protein [Pseudooceanicola sp. LIPI14-2-Ac024]|uniref:ABC transporter ATP-binding protein n=1 Tax=Pseudooceanicola sp. LIPI14-2-Ac024 TaxID=3344875 RepID=UPI0035D0A904
MIETLNVHAGYGDGPDILQSISMNAHAREIVTILGPNGCGKSTLLKTVAGFLKPRQGEVRIDGQHAEAVPIHEKVRHFGVGYVPQTDNVFRTMTVTENLLMGARALDRQTRAERFDALMVQYPTLANKRRRKASALSGGERQILSLARALMAGPRILLLDEPSAGLSPAMMHEVFDAIERIRDEADLCILMVEQNAYEALSISDRAYVLNLGSVALTAPARDLLNDPAMERLYLGGEPEV